MKLLTIILLFISTTSFSQTYLVPLRSPEWGLWGYADLQGNFAVQPDYKLCTDFTEEGCALVLDRRFQIVDSKGNVQITEVKKIKPYTDSWSGSTNGFRNGYLVVSNKGGWGALDCSGKLAIQFKYDLLTDFEGGFAIGKRDGVFFVVSKKGEETRLKVSDVKEVKRFSEGLGIVEVRGEKWGFIDETGTAVITPQFKGVGYFHGGFAWARSDNGLVGFIDKSGNWAVPPSFEISNDLDPESGLAMVKTRDGWGYTNMNAEVVFMAATERNYVFSNGLAIGRKDGKFGYLDNKGEWAITPKYEGAHKFHHGFAAVKVGGKWGVINKKGEFKIPPKFPNIKAVSMAK